MCYAKPGPRCEMDVRTRRIAALDRLEQTRAELAEVNEAFKASKAGEVIFDEDGTRRTTSGLENEAKRLVDRTARYESQLKELDSAWSLTETGIQELQAKASDPALSITERASWAAKAKRAEENRNASIEAANQEALRARNVRIVMEQDGFDAQTIAECNPAVNALAYPRTPKEYKKRIATAEANIENLKKQWAYAVQNAPMADKQSVADAYTRKIADQQVAIAEATKGYNSTAEGLKKLKASSEQKGIRYGERARRIRAYRTALRDSTEQKNSVRLRRMRQRNITRAYKERGLNPKRALNAHKLGNLSASRRSAKPDELRCTISRTALLTETEQAQVQADYRASGASSMSAYVLSKALTSPSTTFTNTRLDDLNAGVKQPTGQPHRQWTKALEEGRPSELSLKVSAHTDSIITGRAKAFHMSRSSYMRAMLLNIDVRQIQNDRSELTNKRKTRKMRQMGLDTANPSAA